MISIIRDSERNEVTIEGSTFIYRRIPASKAMEINRKHNRRGIVDFAEAGFDIVRYCLLDWRDVLDENDEPIPYTPDLINYVPSPVIAELSDYFQASSPSRASLGN